MTTVVLEIPPLTLKPDESPWQNKEVTFLVNIPIALNQQGTQKEKFTVFRYENEGYENFLIWKRALEAFIDEANLLAQPAQKFKFVTRALMGATKDEWKQVTQGRNTADQDQYTSAVNAFTKVNLPEHPAKASIIFKKRPN